MFPIILIGLGILAFVAFSEGTSSAATRPPVGAPGGPPLAKPVAVPTAVAPPVVPSAGKTISATGNTLSFGSCPSLVAHRPGDDCLVIFELPVPVALPTADGGNGEPTRNVTLPGKVQQSNGDGTSLVLMGSPGFDVSNIPGLPLSNGEMVTVPNTAFCG